MKNFLIYVFILIATSHPAAAASTSAKNPEMTGLISQQYEKILKDIQSTLETKALQQDSMSTRLIANLKNFLIKENVFAFFGTLIRIALIIGAFIFLWRLLNKIIDLYITRIKTQPNLTRVETALVVETVIPIGRSILHWITISITGLLVLSEMGINIMPIIYSFSVIGLAISIGSQTLVKDFINGLMTLLEGNMAVGDYVTIGQYRGIVESITLRCVHLRHDSGDIQTIAFSEVNSVINHSRDYHFTEISFLIAHDANYQNVKKALETTYERTKNDAALSTLVKGPLEIKGIKKLHEKAVEVIAKIKTLPDPQKKYKHAFNVILLEELCRLKVPFSARKSHEETIDN